MFIYNFYQFFMFSIIMNEKFKIICMIYIGTIFYILASYYHLKLRNT